MSDTLNIARLTLLLKNHIVEHKQKYLYYAIGMFFIGLIVNVIVLSTTTFGARYDELINGTLDIATTKWETMQTVFYIGGLYIFGGIFSCTSFVNFSNKGEGIFYLIKPASQLEKWLTEVIVHIFLFWLAYTLLFYIIDIPVTFIIRGIEHQDYLQDLKVKLPKDMIGKTFHPSQIFHFSNFKEGNWVVYPFFTSLYVSICAYFMYGSILFNRFAFFKTLILAFVTGMVYFFYALIFLSNKSLLLPQNWKFSEPKTAYLQNEHFDRLFEVELSDNWLWVTGYFLILFVPVVLLACSYFKLKEKEV